MTDYFKDAPDSAIHHAFDSNGTGWWYSNMPYLNILRKCWGKRVGFASESPYIIGDAQLWDDSLVTRSVVPARKTVYFWQGSKPYKRSNPR